MEGETTGGRQCEALEGSELDSCVQLAGRGSSQRRDAACRRREPFWHMGSRASAADTIGWRHRDLQKSYSHFMMAVALQ